LFSFLGGSLFTNGVERRDPIQSLLGAGIMGGTRTFNPVSAAGGVLFADGLRHHRPAETGIGLGIGVLGAVGEAFTSNRQPYNDRSSSAYSSGTYHATNVPAVRYETEAERAERMKREAIEKARIWQAEEELEDARIVVFKQHLELVGLSQEMDYKELGEKISLLKPLSKPAPRFYDSIYTEMPEAKGSNFFHSIITHSKLTADNKLTLMKKLIHEKSYRPHYLLEETCFNSFVNEPAFSVNNDSLKNVYFGSLDKVNELVLHQKIWKTLLAAGPANAAEKLFEGLIPKFYDSNFNNVKRSVEFVKYWLQQSATTSEVIAAWNKIKNIIVITEIKSFDIYFNKLAKQRILEIELQRDNKAGCPSPKGYQHKEIFLNTHRISTFFTCFRTKSKQIYDEIPRNHAKAQRLYEAEQVSIEVDIDKKLRKLHR
jgi:hypothetical protein